MAEALQTTIGFEAEFEVGADDVLRELHAAHPGARIVGTPELHRYHCDCETCGNRYLFHGQTDSSCSGEIITRVISEYEDMRSATMMLQQVATDVDATPGMQSGFHVHVGRPGSQDGRRAAFFEVLRYEHALQAIAAGRFDGQRSNNQSLRDLLTYRLREYVRGPWMSREVSEWYDPNAFGFNYDAALEWVRHHADQASHKEVLFNGHRENDRHSNLNVRTRYDTWEFRFWNSTRSAWRMQMWVGLSSAFTNPQFVAHLMNTDGAPSAKADRGVGDLVAALDYVGLDTTAELVNRQNAYMDKVRSGDLVVPYEFTTI